MTADPVTPAPLSPAPSRPESTQSDRGRQAIAALAPVPFGLAAGAVVGLALFALTAFHTWINPDAEDALLVWLLGHSFLPGVRPTPQGALVALGWGIAWGFVIGCCAAFTRNGMLTIALRWVWWRERLRSQSRVLDDLM